MAVNQMISKLDYHKHSKSLDMSTRERVIVSRCVEQQNNQKKLEPKWCQSHQQGSRSKDLTAAKSPTNRVNSTVSRISRTVSTAIDSPRNQLKPTANATDSDPIWRNAVKASVTGDLGASTESKISKKRDETKAQTSNNRIGLKPCRVTVISQDSASEQSRNRTKKKLKEKSADIVKVNNNNPSPPQSKGQAPLVKSCKDYAEKERASVTKVQSSEERNDAIKNCYVRSKVPVSSKARSSYFRQHSSAGNTRSLQYRSAFDLSVRTFSKKETLISDDANLKKVSLCNRRSLSVVAHQTGSNLTFNTLEEPVSVEKKRLCKSLSNLTAEDVLSVPCSSIHSGKSTSIQRLTPRTNRSNSQTTGENKDIKTPIQAESNRDMPRHIKFSRQRHNGELRVASPVETKRSEKRQETSESINGVKPDPCIIEEEKAPESKTAKKTPKLKKNFFSSLMKKNRKQQYPPSADQAKPVKTQQNTDVPGSGPNASDSKATLKVKESKINKQDLSKEDANSYADEIGFKKISVSPARAQKSIHFAYASRVSKVRSEDANTPLENSTNTSPKPRDVSALKSVFSKDVKVILRNKLNPRFMGSRLSVDFSPNPETATKKFIRRRPSSLAAPSKDPFKRLSDSSPLKRLSDSSKSSFNLNCFSSSDNLDEPYRISDRKATGSVARPDSASGPKLIGYTKVLSSPKLYPTDSSHDLLSKRCSIDLAAIEVESSPLTLTPDDNTRDKSPHIGSGHTSPSSSTFASNGHLAPARASLASSLGSVFEEDDDRKKSASGKQEDAFESRAAIMRHSSNRRNKITRVQRSKSLCRPSTGPGGLLGDKRRSVSPLFGELSFKPSSSQSYTVNKRPSGAKVSRHFSMKETSSFTRPEKPTTPKPRKMSSTDSFLSLNKISLQSLSPPSDQTQSEELNDKASTQAAKEVLLRNLDGRNKASAKNAQIRRRMSLQLSRSRNGDTPESKRVIHEFEDLKRNSMGTFDAEKVKKVMAKWNSASPSVGSSSRHLKRRIRPLSEIQNLKWDVQAIPEHNELANNHNDDNPSTNSDDSAQSTSGNVVFDSLPLSGALQENISIFADGVINEVGNRVLGTCFSEEDIPSAYRDEFLENIRSFPHHVTSLSFYGYSKQEREQGSVASGVEGISNESGYGSMSRRGNQLRPSDLEEEDVFHNNSSRLSNSDFPTENGLFVEALWDHVTMDDEELGFKVGDVIRVIDMSNSDWWWGELDSREGWFPATFVRILVNQHREYAESGDVDDDEEEESDPCECTKVTTFDDEDSSCPCGNRRSTSSVHCGQCGRPWNEVPLHPRDSNHPNHPEIVISAPPPPRKTSVTRELMRKNVINEIINSEKVFVGHLKDVVEGYLSRCRQRPDMFTNEQISIVFSNIQEIYEFQRQFAFDLEEALNRSSVHLTELGNVFLSNKSGFKIYSEYCNNHPQALSLLSQLFNVKKYMQFFEACRLLQRMIDISLDGFLLTPVQKICKYPLQLAELLKFTSPDHKDYEPVRSALVAMKNVARMINERKRMIENIRKISLWQSSVMNWQGDGVLVRSRELVHSGEVYSSKQSKAKAKPRMVFLFDHQLIICKKDLLRKDLLYYKNRLDLDRYVMIPMDGYSPRSSTNLSSDWSSTGSSNVFGWKLTEKSTGESMVMQCKNEEDFDKWMKCFPHEREIALSSNDYEIDFREELAKGLLKTSLVVPRKPKDSSSNRAPPYRYRMKMAQEANLSKQKAVNSAIEKNSSGFLSSFAGKLTPFRRATTREASPVY